MVATFLVHYRQAATQARPDMDIVPIRAPERAAPCSHEQDWHCGLARQPYWDRMLRH